MFYHPFNSVYIIGNLYADFSYPEIFRKSSVLRMVIIFYPDNQSDYLSGLTVCRISLSEWKDIIAFWFVWLDKTMSRVWSFTLSMFQENQETKILYRRNILFSSSIIPCGKVEKAVGISLNSEKRLVKNRLRGDYWLITCCGIVVDNKCVFHISVDRFNFRDGSVVLLTLHPKRYGV